MSDKEENQLSNEDLEQLIQSPFNKKMEITKKIADYYKSGGFNEEQMSMAASIFGALVKDTEIEIRKTLAEAVKNQDNIPRDYIIAMANDIHVVSLPVLQFSEVLTDADLIEIVTSSHDVEKQKMISKRKDVSEELSGALIRTHNEEVVDSLLHNEGATIKNESYDTIFKDFGDKEEIMTAVVGRESLPISIIESLAERISETIYKKLETKHPEAFSKMQDVVKKSKDAATMKVMGMRSSDTEYYHFGQLMEKLRIPKELAPIYAMCMGNINIFEVKVARITQTPVLNIRKLINDTSNRGFKIIYERAEMPDDMYEAAEILMISLRELSEEFDGHNGGEVARKRIARNLTARIMQKVKDVDSIKNMDYILSLVSHYAVSNDF